MQPLAPLDELKTYLPFQLNDAIELDCSVYTPELDRVSPYKLSDCITSLLLLQGHLISHVRHMKIGEAQRVYVDRKHAMELINRVNFIRINNRPLILDAYNIDIENTQNQRWLH